MNEKRFPKKITAAWLRTQRGADGEPPCETGVADFLSAFPRGAIVNPKNVYKAVHAECDIGWLVRLLPTPHLETYEKAVAAHLETYNKAAAPHWETYNKAVVPHWETYSKAVAAHLETYEKARAPHWETYEKAVAAHWETYDKARAAHLETYNKAVAAAFCAAWEAARNDA